MNKADQLVDEKHALITYLLAKVKSTDWHAVADAAMDLREIEAEIKVHELYGSLEKQSARGRSGC
jgi:hypothetical protein